MIFDVFQLDLDVGTLALVIEDLLAKAKYWHDVLPRIGADDHVEDAAILPQDAMRV